MAQAEPPHKGVPDESRELDPGVLGQFVGPRVRVLWNLLSAGMAKALAPFGLRPGAFSALALISANPGCSQNQLARALGMDKSPVVAIVNELERRGLATRVRGRTDRRFHALKLTAKGRVQLERMLAAALRPGKPIRDALSPRELEQLRSLLERAGRALAEAPAARAASSGAAASGARRRTAERTAHL